MDGKVGEVSSVTTCSRRRVGGKVVVSRISGSFRPICYLSIHVYGTYCWHELVLSAKC